MENASKALLMAGGMLLTMLIIMLFLYAWSSYSEFQASQDAAKDAQELIEFNLQYTNYNRNNIQGYEIISLINKVIDYNQRYSSEFSESSSVGNKDQYNPIVLTIKLDESSSTYTNRNKFLMEKITIPATAKTAYKNNTYTTIKSSSSKRRKKEKDYSGKDYRLFTKNEYKQSNATNELAVILNEITKIESYFGGGTNAQNLVKSIGTIFESKIIGYNGQPDSEEERPNWYSENYIKNRYKTLTKITSKIDDIRSTTNVKKVLKYYEYVEFKKAKFKCTKVSYDEYTGRVITMNFEIK